MCSSDLWVEWRGFLVMLVVGVCVYGLGSQFAPQASQAFSPRANQFLKLGFDSVLMLAAFAAALWAARSVRFPSLMEPWDGPANVSFTDGTVIGSVLDRNGLRPGRFWVTSDGLVILASESGVLDLDPATVVRKGRLQPGRMFLVDISKGRIIEDDEIKSELAAQHPYEQWLEQGVIHLDALPEREHIVHTHSSVLRRQQTFGYTEEELRIILSPMAKTGGEALGSMGTDTPLAVLSTRPRLIFDYFAQLFAQVTNPPLDAIREEIVTSLSTATGREGNLLDATPDHCRQVVLPFPVIDNRSEEHTLNSSHT